MKKSLFLLQLMLLVTSCAERGYFIDGNSSQLVLNGKMAYLKDFGSNPLQPLDSCEILHGHFQMSGPADTTRIVSLCMGNDNYMPIVLEGGEIKIDIENTSVSISGTPLNDKLYKFLASRDSVVYLIGNNQLGMSLMGMPGVMPFDLYSEFIRKNNEFNKALEELELQFIKDNYDNVLSTSWFLEICREAERNFGHPVMTPQIKSIYKNAPKKFRNDRNVERYIKASYSY